MKGIYTSVIVLLITSLMQFSGIMAQDKPEQITFEGTVKRASEKIPNINITIYNIKKKSGYFSMESEEIATADTKKGKFLFKLDYNNYYRVIFRHPDFVEMYLDIDAMLPKGIKGVETTLELEATLYKAEDSTYLKLQNFKNVPFTKYKYNNSLKEFRDDPAHTKKFFTQVLNDDVYLKEKKKQDAIKQQKELEEKKRKEEELKNKQHTIAIKIMQGKKLPVANTEIVVRDAANAELYRTSTNHIGKAVIKGLKLNNKYTITNGDPLKNKAKPSAKISLHTRVGSELANSMSEPNSNFTLILETTDSVLNKISSNKNHGIIAGNLIVGDGGNTQPLPNTMVKLVNDANTVIAKTMTNALGGFVFNNIDPDENHMIVVDESDPSLTANKKVSVVTKEGSVVFSTVADAKGKFEFKVLQSDIVHLSMLEVDEEDVKINLKGKIMNEVNKVRTPLENSKVSVVNAQGVTVQTTVTDKEGKFTFTNLSPDPSYAISLDEEDLTNKPKGRLILLTEKENSESVNEKELVKDKFNKYSYQILPTDYAELAEVYVEDPWLNVINNGGSKNVSISENIYFKSNDAHIMGDAKIVLDKVVGIMKAKGTLKIEIGSHSDSKGADAYNLNLSQQRANAAAEYMVSKGIAKARIVAVGYGETKLKNNCGNNVTCTEQEHAQNRRIEFKILAQ